MIECKPNEAPEKIKAGNKLFKPILYSALKNIERADIDRAEKRAKRNAEIKYQSSCREIEQMIAEYDSEGE